MKLLGNIILRTSKGFIEEVNKDRSYNIFKSSEDLKQSEFYKSAYSLESAKAKLSEL